MSQDQDAVSQNQDFKTWSRSASFSLSLSENGIFHLLLIESQERRTIAVGCDVESGYCLGFERSISAYLSKRGLIRRSTKDGYQMNHVLTTEGKLVCELLFSAGFELPAGSGLRRDGK